MFRTETIFDGETVLEIVSHDVSWKQLRDARDQELQSSDWRAVKDRVLPNPWKEYRKFLRDLPQNFETANEAADAWAAYEIPV